jgi:outer membrane immunogenic protein
MATATLWTWNGPAAATDLSIDPAQRYRPPIWSGVYAGLHGGINWLNASYANAGGYDTRTGFGGAHLGFNSDFGSFVGGLEADLNWETAHASQAGSLNVSSLPAITARGSVDLQASGSLRARLGVPVTPTALLYATAGYAWATLDYEASATVGSTSYSYSNGTTLSGLVYGAGAEMEIAPQVLLRLEALHYDYARPTITLPNAATTTIDLDVSSTVVRAGITWRFN